MTPLSRVGLLRSGRGDGIHAVAFDDIEAVWRLGG
jgi:hypothetical protein